MQELGYALGAAIVLVIACVVMTVANYCMLRRTERALSLARLVRDDAIRHTFGTEPPDPAIPTAPH